MHLMVVHRAGREGVALSVQLGHATPGSPPVPFCGTGTKTLVLAIAAFLGVTLRSATLPPTDLAEAIIDHLEHRHGR